MVSICVNKYTNEKNVNVHKIQLQNIVLKGGEKVYYIVVFTINVFHLAIDNDYFMNFDFYKSQELNLMNVSREY